jgi:hypothetical protein
MYGNKYSNSAIKNKTGAQVFSAVAVYGAERLYYVNMDVTVFNYTLGGTFNFATGSYLRNSFADLGVTYSSVDGQYAITYANVKSSLEKGALVYLMLSGHETYDDHHLVCYAYTRLYTEYTNRYKTYLKVSDGWTNSSTGNSRARYVDLATVSSGSKYWEVNF